MDLSGIPYAIHLVALGFFTEVNHGWLMWVDSIFAIPCMTMTVTVTVTVTVIVTVIVTVV